MCGAAAPPFSGPRSTVAMVVVVVEAREDADGHL
jgi:hypothetical protein